MSSTVAEPEVAASTEVYTKEELLELKRRLAGQRYGQGGATTQNPGEPQPDAPWPEDIESLIRFLTGLKTLMRFLVERRVPAEPRAAFLACLPQVEADIDDAIDELRSIDSSGHSLYAALQRLGLTGQPLRLKIGEYVDRIMTGPVKSVLEMADRILGSLFKVLTQLEPVKELKETLESRIEHGADAEIIELGL